MSRLHYEQSGARVIVVVLAVALIAGCVALSGPASALAQSMSAQPEAGPVAPLINLKLPKDLSPWGMFRSADIVVKLVMLGLAFASFLTATLAIAKGLELAGARRALSRGLSTLGDASSLDDASTRLESTSAASDAVACAMTELRRSEDTTNAEGVKERVASRLHRLEAQGARAMSRGTGLLATIGATAPFVGLFGTVWGIMNAFIGISKSQTTNLAVVAPGIAEALLATALGLVVAIPAVVIYNVFTRSIATYRAMLADAVAMTLRLASHDLDRTMSPSGPIKRPVVRQGVQGAVS